MALAVQRRTVTHLVSLAYGTKPLEAVLESLDVGCERVGDGRPRLVQRLVPDRGGETREIHRAREVLQLGLALLEGLGALVLGHEIHLVNEAEDTRIFGAGLQCLEARAVVSKVLLERARARARARVRASERPRSWPLGCAMNEANLELQALDIKHIDQNLDAREDVFALTGKVVLHEDVLAEGIDVSAREAPNERAQPACTRHSPTDSGPGSRGIAHASARHPLRNNTRVRDRE